MTHIRLPFDDHWDHYQRAMSAHSTDDVEAAIARFTKTIGFDRYGYAARRHDAGQDLPDGYRYFHDLDGPLGDSYRTLVDPEHAATEPRVLHARNGLPPVSWNSMGHSNFELPPLLRTHARRKLMITGEFGLHSGITIPIHASGIDWAFVTLSSSVRTSPRELVPLLLTASYFASCLQTAVARLTTTTAAIRPQLTRSECEILRWSAVGKTSWEIARIQKISERTVNYHLYRAASRLGVKGRRAAVAQALALGLIRL